jgi:hypothetical protein
MARVTPSPQRPCSYLARRALQLLLAGFAPWLAWPCEAHMRGMYASKAAAENRAAELKCKGTFAMGTLWMPCANERQLHDALQKAQ